MQKQPLPLIKNHIKITISVKDNQKNVLPYCAARYLFN